MGAHGFRPGRRAHDAVKAARGYVQSGKRVVVDVDLAKFFDRVNHDILIDRLKRRIDGSQQPSLVTAATVRRTSCSSDGVGCRWGGKLGHDVKGLHEGLKFR